MKDLPEVKNIPDPPPCKPHGQDFDWRSLKSSDRVLVRYAWSNKEQVFECSVKEWSPSGDFFLIAQNQVPNTIGHRQWVGKNHLIFLELLEEEAYQDIDRSTL